MTDIEVSQGLTTTTIYHEDDKVLEAIANQVLNAAKSPSDPVICGPSQDGLYNTTISNYLLAEAAPHLANRARALMHRGGAGTMIDMADIEKSMAYWDGVIRKPIMDTVDTGALAAEKYNPPKQSGTDNADTVDMSGVWEEGLKFSPEDQRFFMGSQFSHAQIWTIIHQSIEDSYHNSTLKGITDVIDAWANAVQDRAPEERMSDMLGLNDAKPFTPELSEQYFNLENFSADPTGGKYISYSNVMDDPYLLSNMFVFDQTPDGWYYWVHQLKVGLTKGGKRRVQAMYRGYHRCRYEARVEKEKETLLKYKEVDLDMVSLNGDRRSFGGVINNPLILYTLFSFDDTPDGYKYWEKQAQEGITPDGSKKLATMFEEHEKEDQPVAEAEEPVSAETLEAYKEVHFDPELTDGSVKSLADVVNNPRLLSSLFVFDHTPDEHDYWIKQKDDGITPGGEERLYVMYEHRASEMRLKNTLKEEPVTQDPDTIRFIPIGPDEFRAEGQTFDPGKAGVHHSVRPWSFLTPTMDELCVTTAANLMGDLDGYSFEDVDTQDPYKFVCITSGGEDSVEACGNFTRAYIACFDITVWAFKCEADKEEALGLNPNMVEVKRHAN